MSLEQWTCIDVGGQDEAALHLRGKAFCIFSGESRYYFVYVVACVRQSQIDWRQARMLAKHHDDRWTQLEPSYINQAKRVLETGKTGQEMGKTTSTSTYSQTDPTETTIPRAT